jgi:hypothetical protein
MVMDSSGVALATLIVAAQPPIAGATPAETAAIQSANLAYWTIICAQIISYVQANAVVATVDSVTAAVVASVIAPTGGGPCSGALNSTGTGVGTVS